jgi:hypothetical protein
MTSGCQVVKMSEMAFGRLNLSFIMAACAPIVLAILLIYWPAATAALIAPLTAILFLMFAFSFAKVSDGGVTQPASLLLLSVSLGYFGKLVYVLSGYGESDIIEQHLLLGKGLLGLELGAEVIAVSTGAFLLAYVLPRNHEYATPVYIRHWFSYKRAFNAGLTLFFFSTVCFALYVFYYGGDADLSSKRFGGEGMEPSSRFKEFTYYLFKGALLIKIALYVFLLGSFFCETKLRQRASFFFFLLSIIVFLLLSSYFSNRAGVLVVMLDVLIISYLVVGGIKFSSLLAIVGSGFAFIVAVSSFRSDYGSQKSIWEHIFGGRYFFELSRNTHLFEYFSANNFLPTGDSGLLGAVKQYINLGRLSGEQVFFMNNSGVPLGFPIEMFALGGMPMLMVAMFGLGLLARQVCKFVARETACDYKIVIYSILTTRIMIYMFNNGIGVTTYQILIDLVPFLLIVIFVKSSANSVIRANKKNIIMDVT